jgi:hypothetical protein
LKDVFCFAASICLLALLLLFSSCGSNNNDQARFRVMDTSPGETSFTVTANSLTLNSSVTYGTVSPYNFVVSGMPTLEIEGPDVMTGSTVTLFSGAVTMNQSTTYTVVGGNYPQNFSVTLYTDNSPNPASGNFSLRIINAAPGLGTVDVYIVAPGTNLGNVAPKVPNLAFQAASSYLPLSAGTYEIYFTLAGQKRAYIDSGPLVFDASQIRTFVGFNGSSSGYTDAVLTDLH